MLRSDGSASRTSAQRTSESMGGRSAFADKAAEAAALPDEAAADVLSPSSSVKYVDFAVGSDPAGTAAGSKGAGMLLDKQGSAALQQQPLQPQPPNRPPSDVVLVKVSEEMRNFSSILCSCAWACMPCCSAWALGLSQHWVSRLLFRHLTSDANSSAQLW
jgi:hypothetical protein